ncbi:MAG TPA: hypothetical protein VNI34_10615 [Candidatus Nitrosotalea sp.]|nr:hypothetical protein [Candidatus Nitrosotalea sp.]
MNGPSFVGSLSSGVDGSSEGGRLSSSRLASTLMIYALPLASKLRRGGPGAKFEVSPRWNGWRWELVVSCTGAPPPGVPELWCGHRVVVERSKAPDA